jgi:hypothetical protein
MEESRLWVVCLALIACGGTTRAEKGSGDGGSDGGTASGGENGTGGSTATGGAAPVAPATCLIDSDCFLFEDCCSCRPAAKAAPPQGCAADCANFACTLGGAERRDVKCVAGRCTFDRTCDSRKVTCRIAAPDCAAGTAPEVLWQCYTGKCIAVEHCESVDSCDVCARAGLPCVAITLLGASGTHCVRKPLSCDAPTCECMNACVGLSCLQRGDAGIACYCPAC